MNIVYDIESFPNVFLLVMQRPDTNEFKVFECSNRVNDFPALIKVLRRMKNSFAKMVGFNSSFYDYPVLDYVLREGVGKTGSEIAKLAQDKTNEIINETPWDQKWSHVVWDSNQVVPQIDLFRIHHFDNVAKNTSLKMLEFNMRADNIQELPFVPGSYLDFNQIDDLILYCKHDVNMTTKFLNHSLEKLEFRGDLTKRYARNFMNHNDTKIGKDYFIMRLEENDIECYEYIDGVGRKPRQTKYKDGIEMSDVILPLIHFKRPEFQAVYDWIERQTIKETKGVFTEIGLDTLGTLEQYANPKKVKGALKNLNCIVEGFQFDFGTGGIHGSVESTIEYDAEDWAILDIDVTSYYPSIAITHNLYPAHLGQDFVTIYGAMKKERLTHPKKSPINEMLKLALNGLYGDTNNKYSPFYDPMYTMRITINGQLMLAMLAERLMSIDSLSLLQINTDGMTVRVHRKHMMNLQNQCIQWEHITGMELEQVRYSRMFIRDVNNYIAESVQGKIKRKGVYVSDRHDPIEGLGWHQNHSMLVVPMAAEAALLNDQSIEDFIRNHDDVMDFMLRTKVPRTSRLMIDYEDGDHWEHGRLQNITRYYISNEGGTLDKIMPPLKGKEDERHISINKGYVVTPMNVKGEVKDINYDFYIKEAHKLVNPLLKGLGKELIS